MKINDEYTGVANAKSPIPLYFKCKKCKKRIWNHLYNEHLKFCGKGRRIQNRGATGRDIPEGGRLVNITVGRTKSRHRKRPPVGR
jgi:hypothetical protein